MEPECWYLCPIWFIPSAFLWASLCALCEHFHICDWFSTKFNWEYKTVEKWMYRLLGLISLLLILIILCVVSYLIKFDLLNWEPF